MRFGNVHQEKLNFVLVRHVQVFHGPGLGPKRRSGITAEDKTDRFFAAKRSFNNGRVCCAYRQTCTGWYAETCIPYGFDYFNALTICAGLDHQRRQSEIGCNFSDLKSRLGGLFFRFFALLCLGCDSLKRDVLFAQFQRRLARQVSVSGKKFVHEEGCLLMPG